MCATSRPRARTYCCPLARTCPPLALPGAVLLALPGAPPPSPPRCYNIPRARYSPLVCTPSRPRPRVYCCPPARTGFSPPAPAVPLPRARNTSRQSALVVVCSRSLHSALAITILRAYDCPRPRPLAVLSCALALPARGFILKLALPCAALEVCFPTLVQLLRASMARRPYSFT